MTTVKNTIQSVVQPYIKFHNLASKKHKILNVVGGKECMQQFIDLKYEPNENQVFILGGDYEDDLNIDDKLDAIFFRQSFQKSKKNPNELLIPSSYGSVAGDATMSPCEITEKPKISFCGSKTSHPCRKELFDMLENSQHLACNFEYTLVPCCGAVDPTIHEKSNNFNINLKSSEFTFCPRGNGNFSIRFYEALMSGRIPILLKSDNELPFENLVNWNESCVIANNKEELVERILQFHTTKDLINIQLKNKQLFQDLFVDNFDVLLMDELLKCKASLNSNIILIPKTINTTNEVFNMKKRCYPNFHQASVYALDLSKPFFFARGSGQESWISFNLEILKDETFANNTVVNASGNFFVEGCGIYFQNMDSAKKYATRHVAAFKKVHLFGAIDKTNHPFQLKFTELLSECDIDITLDIGLVFHPEYVGFNNVQMRQIFQNKRVLVVSSHKDSIDAQIPKLKHINPFLATCTFQTIRPPQTSCGNHGNLDWSQHLEPFLDTIQNVDDFDIALVAAGGYSILISEYIFETMKKSVIYPGGALQLWFGIMGNRWKSWWNYHTEGSREHWIEPLESDKPLNSERVDRNGAYW